VAVARHSRVRTRVAFVPRRALNGRLLSATSGESAAAEPSPAFSSIRIISSINQHEEHEDTKTTKKELIFVFVVALGQVQSSNKRGQHDNGVGVFVRIGFSSSCLRDLRGCIGYSAVVVTSAVSVTSALSATVRSIRPVRGRARRVDRRSPRSHATMTGRNGVTVRTRADTESGARAR